MTCIDVLNPIQHKESMNMTHTNAGDLAGATNTAEPHLNNEMFYRSMSTGSFLTKEDEEVTCSALSAFKVKESEIERRKMEVRERVQAQLSRVEEETRRLATVREELESFADPMRKELWTVRKKIDNVHKELKPLSSYVQKKQREYKEAVDAYSEKNLEKIQLITKLMDLSGESENLRLKKLEELSKSVN